jgi:hypothetical protein
MTAVDEGVFSGQHPMLAFFCGSFFDISRFTARPDNTIAFKTAFL